MLRAGWACACVSAGLVVHHICFRFHPGKQSEAGRLTGASINQPRQASHSVLLGSPGTHAHTHTAFRWGHGFPSLGIRTFTTLLDYTRVCLVMFSEIATILEVSDFIALLVAWRFFILFYKVSRMNVIIPNSLIHQCLCISCIMFPARSLAKLWASFTRHHFCAAAFSRLITLKATRLISTASRVETVIHLWRHQVM